MTAQTCVLLFILSLSLTDRSGLQLTMILPLALGGSQDSGVIFRQNQAVDSRGAICCTHMLYQHDSTPVSAYIRPFVEHQTDTD